jgi:uncharacterized protein (TIGR02231 family)
MAEDLSTTIRTDAPVTSVTIYGDRATIARRITVSLTGNEREIAIENLPAGMLVDSIRASGEGSVAVKILGVRSELMFFEEPIADRLAELEAEDRRLERQQQSWQAKLDAANREHVYLQDLIKNTPQRRRLPPIAEIVNLLDFTTSRQGECSDRLLDYQERISLLRSQRSVLSQQIQQLKTPRSQESYTIFTTIAAAAAGEFTLEIEYTTFGASWRPLYDLRVDSPTKTIVLGYLAEISQNTGEDWQDIQLILSTAKPALGSLPPKLEPWYIDIERPAPPPQLMMRARDVTMAGMPPPPAPGMDLAYVGESWEDFSDMDIVTDNLAKPKPVAATKNLATIERTNSVVTFKIDRSGNIPSDGNPRQVTILTATYPCEFNYIAIPKLVSFAYLQAKSTNPQNGSTLLPGSANIYRDNTFVGTTSIPNIAPGQELTLDLGIDESLEIERELIERQVEKKFLGSNRRMTFAYRVKINNLLPQVANLTLREQIPKSRREQIEVKLQNTSPNIPPSEMGLLEWRLELSPNAKREVTYQFAIEYPNQSTIVGLEDEK